MSRMDAMQLFRIFFVLSFVLSGCSAPSSSDNSCELANRQATFDVLLENSITNMYNRCLSDLQQEVADAWGAP